MKITKSSEVTSSFTAMKATANIGCNVCPCCGETKSWFQYMEEDGVCNKGVSGGLAKSWIEGVFRLRCMKCDCYKCYSCGAEWESEPYQWA